MTNLAAPDNTRGRRRSPSTCLPAFAGSLFRWASFRWFETGLGSRVWHRSARLVTTKRHRLRMVQYCSLIVMEMNSGRFIPYPCASTHGNCLTRVRKGTTLFLAVNRDRRSPEKTGKDPPKMRVGFKPQRPSVRRGKVSHWSRAPEREGTRRRAGE